MFHSPAILFTAALALAFASPAAADMDRFISVEGAGTVLATPDIAVVSAGVVTRAASAAEAVRLNNAAMPALLKALKDMGVKDQDLRTLGFNVAPRRGRRSPGDTSPGIKSYQVSNRVEVTVRDLGKLGALLDRMAVAGANTIHGVRFDLADPDRVQDRARQKAVADARRRAELYAEATGLRLGKVLRIEERRTRFPRARAVAISEIRSAGVVPVKRGQLKIRAAISVIFAIE